jgi:hypothetical protein
VRLSAREVGEFVQVRLAEIFEVRILLNDRSIAANRHATCRCWGESLGRGPQGPKRMDARCEVSSSAVRDELGDLTNEKEI